MSIKPRKLLLHHLQSYVGIGNRQGETIIATGGLSRTLPNIYDRALLQKCFTAKIC